MPPDTLRSRLMGRKSPATSKISSQLIQAPDTSLDRMGKHPGTGNSSEEYRTGVVFPQRAAMPFDHVDEGEDDMSTKVPSKTALSAAIGILCGTGAGVAFAQQVATDQLAEIIVTAQKRESTVQTTPLSITALTGQDLVDRGLTDIASIVQSVPGVSMRTSGPGQTELEMRGMTSSGGNSATVGFYLDDIPLSAPASAQNGKVVIDPNLYDLNRVEVLRGPQGTLYGSGSMGGTIKLVPNAPNPSAFDASAQVILGGTDGGDTLNHTENAMVNLPLNDMMALRVVASSEVLSGWIDRIVIAQPDFPAPINATTRGNVAAAPVAQDFKDVNDENLRSVRASFLWKPTDQLS